MLRGMIPRALILAPTRELVMQIEEEVSRLAQIYRPQAYSNLWRTGPNYPNSKGFSRDWIFFVATPGRLMDLYFREVLVVKELNIASYG